MDAENTTEVNLHISPFELWSVNVVKTSTVIFLLNPEQNNLITDNMQTFAYELIEYWWKELLALFHIPR